MIDATEEKPQVPFSGSDKPSDILPQTPPEVLDEMLQNRSGKAGQPIWERKGITEKEYEQLKKLQVARVGSKLLKEADKLNATDEQEVPHNVVGFDAENLQYADGRLINVYKEWKSPYRKKQSVRCMALRVRLKMAAVGLTSR